MRLLAGTPAAPTSFAVPPTVFTVPVLPEEGQKRKGGRTGTAFAGKGAKGSLIRTEITVHFVSMMIDLLHADYLLQVVHN